MLVVQCLGAAAGDIVVSATGPCTTLEAALKQAREWRRLNDPRAEGGINIVLEGGVHRLTKPLYLRPEDSGTAESPTVIRGRSGERAVITSGKTIEGWQLATDSRLPKAAQGKVWVTTAAPMTANRILETRQLWVNGSKALRAQQLPKDSMTRMLDFDVERQCIVIPGTMTAQQPPQLEMLVHQRWATAILRVKDILPTDGGSAGAALAVTFHEPESAIEFAHPWPQPVIDGERGNSSFCLMNALEFVDEPGEWYQDYPSGLIYYYPRENEDMLSAEVVAPVLETLIEIDGTRERPISNIRFENIGFEHTVWNTPSLQGHVTLQGGFAFIDGYKLHEPGLFHKAELENQAWIERPQAAVKARFANGLAFSGCTFQHLSSTGLDLEYAVSNVSIDHCTLTDIGGTAILAGYFGERGFETHIPYKPTIADDLCRNITISNNTITDAANEDWGCVAIGAGYVRDTRIERNHVTDVSYSGIAIGWGWTALESGMCNNHLTGNTVSNYAKRLYDAGGLYTLSYQPGSTITGNTISLPYPAPYATNHRAFCIYFDEATDGFTVENNYMAPLPASQASIRAAMPGAPMENEANMFGWNKPGPHMKVEKLKAAAGQ